MLAVLVAANRREITSASIQDRSQGTSPNLCLCNSFGLMAGRLRVFGETKLNPELSSACEAVTQTPWFPCSMFGRSNGRGVVASVQSFLDESCNQSFLATPISKRNLNFHRGAAGSSNRTASRHAKHGRETEPCHHSWKFQWRQGVD